MFAPTSRVFCRLVILLIATCPAIAQQASPRIGYVYPAGGRQGTTFEVAVGGQYLDGSADVYFSGRGLSAKVIEHTRPLSVKQAGLLKDELKELLERRAAVMRSNAGRKPATRAKWTTEDDKRLQEIRKKLETFIPKTQINPAIAETVTIEVAIAADAEPGERNIRLRTPQGMTNPLAFCVGQLPEFSKKPARPFREPKDGVGPKPPPADRDVNITIPATVNGQIMPGAVDRIHFKAKKGQKIVVAASARALIPYLPDAVPGWFQATLALRDASGKELSFVDDFRFNPDPVLFYEIPADGEYVAEIRDSVYRGREDFVYRISIGELPFITSIYPLGGKVGAEIAVNVKGWNLPANRLTQDARSSVAGILPVSMRKGDLISNQVPFLVDALPECMEQEPNNMPITAQAVKSPIIINGRIDKPGDWDIYRIEGRPGDEIVAEVYARRLNSPLDSILKLTDADGKELAANDDHEDKGSGLNTHHADSLLRFVLPVKGNYYVHVGDTQQQGGEEYAYRLRISAPQPDFQLRVTPSGINARGGTSVPVTVYALRQDGFAGEIVLSLKDAPPGVSLTGAVVPARQDQVRMTLTVPPTAMQTPLVIEGKAMIRGREVIHRAVPAEDMMQAFAYRHLVPAQESLLTVGGRFMARATPKIISPTPVRIPAGGTALVRVDMPLAGFLNNLKIELSEPPDGISIKSVSTGRAGTDIVLQCDAAKIRPGLKGNLILISSVAGAPAKADKPQGGNRPLQIGALPAVPFEVTTR